MSGSTTSHHETWETPISQSAPNQEIMKHCIRIMDKFQLGLISKVQVILELHERITQENKNVFTTALATYIKVLNRYKHIHLSSDKPTEVRVRDRGKGSKTDKSNDAIDRTSKQCWTQPLDMRSSNSDNNAPTKAKINLKSLPCIIRHVFNPITLSLSLSTMQSILKNISQDFKAAKALLFNSLSLPQFPESKWVNLLLGQVVDLNWVLASIYTTTYDDKWTEQAGELEFVTWWSKSIKTVETHRNWVSAWDTTVEATTHIFENHTSKLKEYGQYITFLFTILEPQLHRRILRFDQAVQNCVTQWQDLLLTDYNAFSGIHVLHIQNQTVTVTIYSHLNTITHHDYLIPLLFLIFPIIMDKQSSFLTNMLTNFPSDPTSCLYKQP